MMLNIMPMGDSITHGFNVSGGYRKPLLELLKARGLSVNFVGRHSQAGDSSADRDHWGRPGWGISRTDAEIGGRRYVSLQANEGPQGAIRDGLFQDLDQAISSAYFSRDADAVNILLLMVGTNDIIHQVVERRDGAVAAGDRNNDGRGEQQDRLAEATFDRLVTFLTAVNRRAADNDLQLEVIVATIPDFNDTWNRERLKDPISALMRQEARAYNTSILEELPGRRYSHLRLKVVDQFTTVGDDLDDGLHPTASALARMAETWWDGIATVLAEREPPPALVHAFQVDGEGQLDVSPGDAPVTGVELIGDAEGDDQLRGTDLIDVLRGRGGNDTLQGLAGDDRLIGNQGRDVLLGNQGHDHLVGGQGDDLIRGGRGRDLIEGGLGSDMLFGDLGSNIFLSSVDGFADTLVITCDSPATGSELEKPDVIEAIDPLDRIVILGADSASLSMAPLQRQDIRGNPYEGLGIFAHGQLEAIVLDRALSASALAAQLTGLPSEDLLEIG